MFDKEARLAQDRRTHFALSLAWVLCLVASATSFVNGYSLWVTIPVFLIGFIAFAFAVTLHFLMRVSTNGDGKGP